MKRREAGFSLIEMLIGIAISVFVLAAAITFFLVSARQFKVQTKIVETNVEGILGLELLRRDLEGIGFGLPWNPPALAAYAERPSSSNPAEVAALNDSPNPPRAVLSIDNATTTVNRSDYLVIKSTRVGMDNAAGKWTTLDQAGNKRRWTPASENINDTDYVYVLAVGTADSNRRSLVDPGTPYTTFNSSDLTNLYAPVEVAVANIVYGVGRTQPVRPFNRADYHIIGENIPRHCAPGTGVLVKDVIEHNANGTVRERLPLLDCVADMQVLFGLDTNGDGAVELPFVSDITGLNAEQIRTQLAEVRVHILAQEGMQDNTYRTPTDFIFVGSDNVGSSFDVRGLRNFRWRNYSIVVKPQNLAR